MNSTPAIKVQSPLQLMAEASELVSKTIFHVGKYIRPGVSTLELDTIAEDFILSHNAEPAFKGYKPDKLVFPYTLCISINEQVVHGMPSSMKVIQEGDIVSVDCGVKKNGYFGDSAFTFPVGEISEEKRKLIDVTRKSLELGVEQAITGNKVYQIAGAVQRYAESHGFSVVRELVGHGIGSRLHQEPSVPNFVPSLLQRKYYPNAKLIEGQGLAIEPMINAGSLKVVTEGDGWTIRTADGKPSAHFEHTVVVQKDKPLILTYFED